MNEEEFQSRFTPGQVSIGQITFADRWEGWSPKTKAALLRVFQAAHDLGLDWFYIGGTVGDGRLRAGRRDRDGKKAKAGTNIVLIDLHDNPSIWFADAKPEFENLSLDNIPVDPMEVQVWITSGTLREFPMDPERSGYWPCDYPTDNPTGPKEPIEGVEALPATESNPMDLNTILYGPPGTGKTFATLGLALSRFPGRESDAEYEEIKRYAVSCLKGEYAAPPTEDRWRKWVAKFDSLCKAGRIEFTTFHQNYAYEDFVEGIRADADGTGVTYAPQPGIFKRLAYRALYAWLTGTACPPGEPGETTAGNEEAAFAEVATWLRNGTLPVAAGKKPVSSQEVAHASEAAKAGEPHETSMADTAPAYVLIIDEINRGNMARILGELITLLEQSKRARNPDKVELGQQPLQATLPYTREPFIVPPNLYILGTMNTADRSLIGLDVALRRRFSFVELPPRPEALSSPFSVEVKLKELLEVINSRIEERLDADHLIGHAFLMGVKNIEELNGAMRRKVIPQLREYFHDRPQDLRYVLSRAGEREECDFLVFDGAGRELRLRGVKSKDDWNAQTYQRLIPTPTASSAGPRT